MGIESGINRHYGEDILEERALNVLRAEGLDRQDLDWGDLSRLDQFHTGGLETTRILAEWLAPSAGTLLLDLGSGIGGPARYLAATWGCRVTGIDLNPAYVRIATDFSARSGLSERTRFVEGNALRMPFPDESFDYVWTQHVAMNIQDRTGLYREVRRVLKPDGRFACHDIVLGNGEPIEFPLPWAATDDMSNVISIPDMNAALEAAGFRETGWRDVTDHARAFVQQQRERAPEDGERAPANLVALIGEQFVPLVQNLGRQIMDGRLRAIMTIQRPD